MSGVVEDTEEGPASGNGGVQASQEDEGGNHEREGNFLVQRIQRTKSRRSNILASVDIHDSTNDAEDDDFGNCASPQRLGEFTVIEVLA